MTRRMHSAKTRPTNSLRSRLFVRALEARCVPAIFTVTTTADSGPGSFRQACIDASANAAFDEIQFSSLFDSDQTISLTSQVTLASDAKITGPTAGKLTIAGTGGGRIMYFNLASAVATATISGIRFTGGNTAGRGGAIFVGTSEKLTLTDCVVENNKAADSGGAINVNNGGSLTLQRCSITGNQGGIGTTGYRVGGGIYFRNSGNLLVENTTISGNTAAFGGGGGVYFYGNASGGNITIRNSTISGNTSAGIGGGIALYKFSSGSVLLQNVTLVNNTAVGDGGGVIQSDSPVSFSVESTVIANNTAGGASQDFAGALVANFSLVRDQTGTTVLPGSANNLAAATDPLLGTLAANGGGFLTHLPLAGSPLIDNGSNPTGLTTDQRGVGFARVVGQADIGAVEVQAAAGTPSAKSTPPNVTKAGETSYTFSVTYEDDTAIKGSTIGTGDITVLGPSPANFSQVASLVSVVPGGDGSPLVATYTITAPGGAWNDTHNGSYTIKLNAGAVSDTVGNFVPAGPVATFKVLAPRTFVVTNTADSGPGSLRQAVLDANVFESVGDVINFSPGVFGTGATITLNTSVPITNAVTIEGLGRSKVVVAGAGTDRLFVVDGSGVFDVTFKALTLTGGNAAATSGVGRRGGVAVVQDERVTIDDCLVSNNISAMEGGVIGANGPANITLVNSTFTGNSAAQDGGVLYFYDGGDFTINGCTLSGNTSSAPLYGGGAVYFFGSAADGTLDIVNSTISGNFSNISGGGVAVRTFGGNLRVRNSTIVANSAGGLSPGQGGGGIAVIGGTGSVSLESSIVSGNTAPLAPDIVSTPQVTATNSAIGDSIGFTLSPGSGSNLPFATDLKLDPTLAANGGTNFSHLPLSGSPLRNAGANPAGLSFDQRGPGFPRVLGSKADIGAIESVDPIPTAVAQATNLIASGGTQHTITVTFEDDVAINVGTIQAGNLSITTPSLGTLTPSSVTVDLGSNGTPRVATFTIAAPGGTWDGTDTGTYVVNMLANQVADTGGSFVPAGQIGSFDVLLPRVIEVTDAGDSGPGTLRDALARANQFVTPEGPDTITFSKTLFVAAQPLLLGSAVPITDHVVVIGPGIDNVTIDATGQGRHFTISGPGTLSVSLSGMTLINGVVNGLDGGAIFTDDEDVTLDRMFISGNQATGAAGDGGAIGVGAFGKLTLLRSTVSGNAAPGGAGGGIYFLNNGELTIVDSTLSGNSSLDGGAVYFFGTANNDIIIRNSTLYANQAGRGAGVTLNAFAGKLTVQNSTIAKNTATTTDGGGIFRSDTSTGTIALLSSIVAENGDESTTLAPDVYSLGAVTSIRSALTSTAGMSAFSDLGGTLIGQNLDLQPLAKNGGPTETLALGPASKAIDAGFNATPTSNDQRGLGFVRTFDQAGSPNAADGTDIGAFELQPAAPITPAKVLGVVINNGDAQRSRVTTLRVNFNQPVAITDVSKAITLNRVSDSASVTLNAVLDGTGTFVTVTFVGGAIEGAPGKFSLQDGRYTLTVLAGQFAGAGLDGNGDNTAGDNFVLLSTPYGTPSPMSPATGVFRLAGDGNGDGIVDPSDFLLFRLSFLSSNDAFDFDGVNGVDANDFLRFRLNFLKQVV